MADDDLTPDLLGRWLRRAARRGRTELTRVADRGRQQLALRQAQRDLDAFWIRMGRTAYRLVEAGEIEHPALVRAMHRIDELQARIDALEAGVDDTPVGVTGERRAAPVPTEERGDEAGAADAFAGEDAAQDAEDPPPDPSDLKP